MVVNLLTPTSNSGVGRSPLSNITNVDTNQVEHQDYVERRKLRKLYLDNKRRNANNKSSTSRNVIRSSNVSLSDTNHCRVVTPIRSSSYMNTMDGRILPTTPLTNPYEKCTSVETGRSPLANITNVVSNDVEHQESAERRKLRKLYLDNKRRKANNKSSTSRNIIRSSNVSQSVTNDCRVVTPIRSSSNINTLDRRILPTTPLTNPYQAYTSVEAGRNPLANITNVETGRSPLANITNGVKRIQRIKQRLSTKGHCVYPVIMVDLSSDNHIIPKKIAEDPYKGVSNNYLHHGDQVVVCDVCNAKLWKVEAGKGRVYLGRKSYMLCCGYGKVHLPNFKETYQEYQNLFKSLDDKSKHFLLNIRRFNSMFSFTSMGGKVDSKINRGNAPYVYRISGEDYHTLGSLLPKEGGEPKFAHLYIYDTNNEVCNCKTVFSNSKKPASATSDLLDTELIEYLKLILDSNNQLVKTYRRVRDRFVDNPHIDLKLRLKANRSRDGRTYNLPTSSEVAALIVGDIEDALDNRDVVVESKKDGLQRISELHPSYLALQYPLLFPFGEDGYRVDILHREGRESRKKKESKCTMREYFAYNVQDRVSHFSLILNARRLLQQFLVDVYTMIESERLLFIRLQQNNLRSEIYENLRKLGQNGNPDMSNVGTRVLLPSSFTGGSRYMRKNYYDAMAICKWFGYPDFFITITCNPKWPEIKIFLKNTNINPEDRPDILCRLFKIKLDAIMKDLQETSLFGNALAVVYTIKFQKRGLPHAHICLFLNDESKLPSVEHVDNFISAEIPDKNLDPDLYTLVSDYMIHGPCGVAKPNYPCMVDGPDRAEFGFIQNADEGQREDGKDEIKEYYDCRYLSASEASWRIFAFDVHYRYPSVIRLPFHLPDKQNVIYGPDDDLDSVLQKPFVASTMFLGWMEKNEKDPLARTLTYVEFPTKFVVGPKSFEEIRTVNGEVFPTFRDTCYARGLLDDVKEYIEDIKEAYYIGSGYYLRNLFAKMLASITLSRPEHVWENTWEYLSDGILYNRQKLLRIEGLSLPEEQIRNLTLLEIARYLLRNNSSLSRFPSMPQPGSESIYSADNRLIADELRYDVSATAVEFHNNLSCLTDEQRLVFDEIIEAVNSNAGGVFFVYGYGGTGKTFLWKTLSASIRCKGDIVLNVASSGIASLLLPGGRTVHSRFHIPLNLTESSMCFIKPDDDVADLLRKTKLIIWDEAPMNHKHAFEALDRTMKDIFKCEMTVGGKVMVFGGDFIQILPIVPNGSRREIVNASITLSYIWSSCEVLTLTKNMRLTVGANASDIEEIKAFANWLLELGEGKIGDSDDCQVVIDISEDLLIKCSEDPMSDLIDFVYPSLLQLYKDKDFFFFAERAILAPTNEVVQEINERLLTSFPGDEVEYLSF
ncbi:uncharacterized protein LOC110931708 [Helianthus annuus]|uniref:uncharacterized protein LOC110931708 n=1 Tax=Helianthus annuus TaxID=4232 RepID=UPI000B8F713E|nr:uncharacterized protein LOC110931708 [Helianthus annuus]